MMDYRNLLSSMARERLRIAEEAQQRGELNPLIEDWMREFAHKGDGARLRSYDPPTVSGSGEFGGNELK